MTRFLSALSPPNRQRLAHLLWSALEDGRVWTLQAKRSPFLSNKRPKFGRSRTQRTKDLQLLSMFGFNTSDHAEAPVMTRMTRFPTVQTSSGRAEVGGFIADRGSARSRRRSKKTARRNRRKEEESNIKGSSNGCLVEIT